MPRHGTERNPDCGKETNTNCKENVNCKSVSSAAFIGAPAREENITNIIYVNVCLKFASKQMI